jgi:hypothetical protein
MKPEALVPVGRSGGLINNLFSFCWLLGHDWIYLDGRGNLVCRLCGKVA